MSAPLEFQGGIVYTEHDGVAQRLDVLAPPPAPEPRPVVLYLHGGAWREGDRGSGMRAWINPLLAEAGFVTLSASYRLSGAATWPAQLDDAREAIAWTVANAARFGGDPVRLGVWGFSAGAHLAALTALEPGTPVRAVALAATPADLRDVAPDNTADLTPLLGHAPTRAELADLSPVTKVRPTPPPTLLAHGTKDDVTPVEWGRTLRDALTAAGGVVEWHEFPGADHLWAATPPVDDDAVTFGSLALPFFTRHLGGAGRGAGIPRA